MRHCRVARTFCRLHGGVPRFLCSSDRSFYDDIQDLHPGLPAVQADVPDRRVSVFQHCAVPRTNPFPAALVGTMRGIQPERIFCSHWSAISPNTGAQGIAVGYPLPAPPAGLILLSPWTDMGGTRETPELAMLSFVSSDTLRWGLHGRKAYPKLARKRCCGHNRYIPQLCCFAARFYLQISRGRPSTRVVLRSSWIR